MDDGRGGSGSTAGRRDGRPLLSQLALLLIRVAERRTGPTCRRIEIEFSTLHAVTLTGSAGTRHVLA